MTYAHKRALIISFYLSRFDRKGVRALGYTSFNEAFSELGKVLSVKPATIKNMRDSFDPYCSQVRMGWHQRKILRSRANIIEAYSELGEAAMFQVVRTILSDNQTEINLYIAPIANVDEEAEDEGKDALIMADDNPFATRLRTGEEAELFFIANFSDLPLFAGSQLEDTRKFGTGFDFRAAWSQKYQAIEVKGITKAHGYISFTDKEWTVANLLQDDYILAIVRNLETAPKLDLITNPALAVPVNMRSIESVAISWSAKV